MCSVDGQIHDIPIYNSNLGGEGDIDHDYCLTDDLWNKDEYSTDFLCADDEETHNCCLKRYHIEADNSTLYTGTPHTLSLLYILLFFDIFSKK